MTELLYSPERVVVALGRGGDIAGVVRSAQAMAASAPTLSLLHVLAPLPLPLEQVLFPYAAMGLDEDGIWSEILTAAREQIVEEWKTSTPDEGVELPPMELRRGEVAEEVAAFARKQGAELLLCGARSRDYGDPLGASAERILRRVHCPTLLVKRGASTKIKKVLIALGGDAEAETVLRWGLSFACWQKAEVDFVSVLSLSPQHWVRDLLESERMAPALAEAEKRLRERVQGILDMVTVPFAYEAEAAAMKLPLHVRRGHPVRELVDSVAELNADVLVMGRGGRGGRLGSVCLEACAAVSSHVLVVPPNAA